MDRIMNFNFEVNGDKYEVKSTNVLMAKIQLIKMLEEKQIIKSLGIEFTYFEDYLDIVNLYLQYNKHNGTLSELFDTRNVDLTRKINSIFGRYDFSKDHAATSSINAITRHLLSKEREITIENLLNMPLSEFHMVRNLGESRLITLIKLLSLMMPFNQFEIKDGKFDKATQ